MSRDPRRPSALSRSSVPRAPSRVLPRSPASSTLSLDPLALRDLPAFLRQQHHPRTPRGLVRGSILTAGVARTPILSVPANRRVSSKVSLHLLRRFSSSGHPRVTLHNRHPLWPPYSTLRLTPSMSSVTRPWRVPPYRSRPLVHLLSLEHQHLPHSRASSTSILSYDRGIEKAASSPPFPRETSGNQVQNYRRQYREGRRGR